MTEKHNHILIILDGLRYDVVKRTELKNLPNNNQILKAHSHAVWTVPSMLSYLLGYSPTNAEDWAFFDGDPGVDRLAQHLKEKGYATEFYSGSAWMKLHEDLFSQGFGHYDASLEKNRLDEYADAEFDVYKDEDTVPFFQVFHVMETHHPSYDGEETTEFKKDIFHNFEAQQNALKYVDEKIGEIIEKLPEGTRVTITADHGDAWGEEQSFGHNPNGASVEGFKLTSMPNTVHEIPYMRGRKEEGSMIWKKDNYMKDSIEQEEKDQDE